MKRTLLSGMTWVLALLLITTGCTDEDNEVIISLDDLTVTVDENPEIGHLLGKVESNSSMPLTFSIVSQTPSGAINIDEETGELTVAIPDLFDFEANPVISATISAEEAENTASVIITVNNVNELSVQDFSVSIDENPANGQSLGSVQASGDGTIVYSIASSTPSGALNIDASTGELTVADAALFDFETNSAITADISVDNAGNIQTLTATINLNNVNEVTVQDFSVAINENPANGLSLGTVQASGVGTSSFSIASSSPSGAVSIDQNTGELTVEDFTLFDFETNPVITATVQVNNSGETASLTATIDLSDLHEVGEFKFGGVIFWIDPTSNNSSGLVCDIDNIANPGAGGITWSVGTNVTTGATGTAIGTGEANTTAIVNSYGTGSVYAAALCVNSTAGGFSDWYLPSIFELHEIYYNLAAISATAQANGGSALTGLYHWTSTEITVSEARVVSYNGTTFSDFSAGKNNSGALVRAVRSWTDF
ncbi:MAG: hypothetical protein ABJH04_06130 [Cyclobacteriaceae bacterium]